MEPFGLLSFLQTLLSANEQNTQNPTAETAPENGQEIAVNPAENTEQFPFALQSQTENQKAFLGFLDEHEKRAKSLRK